MERVPARDVRAYVHGLEAWMIATLADFGVKGETRAGRVGIWVVNGGRRRTKIGAIGVRVSRWVSWHGMALNVHPDLSHFQRHRALRDSRAWRHQPGGPGRDGDDGGGGCGAAEEFHEYFRMKIFLYGTLADPAGFGPLRGPAAQGRPLPAGLHGFRRVLLRGARYPTLRRAPGAAVHGVIVRVNADMLVRLQAYESVRYQQIHVRLHSATGPHRARLLLRRCRHA